MWGCHQLIKAFQIEYETLIAIFLGCQEETRNELIFYGATFTALALFVLSLTSLCHELSGITFLAVLFV
jgi:hypothetical protein